MTCPQCGKNHEYCYDLGRVIYCDCGYCEHVSVTNGVCDYCGKVMKRKAKRKNPEIRMYDGKRPAKRKGE